MRFLLLSLPLVFSTTFAFAGAVRCAGAVSAPSKHEIAVQLAREVGLHYAETAGPGYSRQANEQQGFTYLSPAGEIVTDPEVLARIKAMKIPPGWSHVWVAVDPLEHVQARGTDAKNRVQSRYHPLWETGVKATAKFERMQRFGESLPALRKAVNADLKRPALEKEARLAAITRLLEVAGIRIGGEKYAQENEHYGLTTLQVRHVKVSKASVVFHFIGKEGVEHDIAVPDAAIARVVAALVEGKSPDDSLFDVSASNVNDYIKARSGPDFSAKDFRTWVGTTTAAKVLAEAGTPVDDASAQRAEKAAATAASDRLGNEPETAREHYIAPVVFEAYRSGKLAQIMSEVQSTNRPVEEAAVLRLVKGAP